MKLRKFIQVAGQVGMALVGGAVAGGAALGVLARSCAGPALVPASPLVAVVAKGPGWEVARVVRVVDGDTYDVLVGGAVVRVRLLGVDAPEHDQPFGVQVTDSARAVLQGRVVRVRRVKTDLYGRTLGNLVLSPTAAGAAEALDSLLVVRGWAWAFDPEHARAWRDAQQVVAQRAGRGLWKCGTAGAVPPKVWRGLNQENKRRYVGSCAW